MVLLNQDLVQEVLQLRQQGLTDTLIEQELGKKGYNPQQIRAAVSQADTPPPAGEEVPAPSEPGMPEPAAAEPMGPQPAAPPAEEGNIYERIEEITESMIDEKWDELIAEVKKIVAWKDKIEEKQTKMMNDLDKLKEDFKVLHQGVLGKLEDYDTKMSEVGTELKAVGKVFKDVIPEFVENVKELKEVTGKVKEG